MTADFVTLIRAKCCVAVRSAHGWKQALLLRKTGILLTVRSVWRITIWWTCTYYTVKRRESFDKHLLVASTGFPDHENRYLPEEVPALSYRSWKHIVGGPHHTLLLDTHGKLAITACGRLLLRRSIRVFPLTSIAFGDSCRRKSLRAWPRRVWPARPERLRDVSRRANYCAGFVRHCFYIGQLLDLLCC